MEELGNKIAKLHRKICCLSEGVNSNTNNIDEIILDLESLEYVKTITDFRLSGSVLEIEFEDNNGNISIVSQDIFTLQESSIKNNVQNYTELLTVQTPELYEFAYVRESQGTQWLPAGIGGTYYGSGLYMWNGVEWQEDDTNVFNQLEQLINNLNLEIQQRINADSALDLRVIDLEKETWADLVLKVKYTGNDTIIASGEVLECLFNSTTIYRFINSTNDVNGYSIEDSFYENFDGTNLNNLIATRH